MPSQSLDFRRHDHDVGQRPAAAGDLEEVAHGRAGGAGDDGDLAREAGQGALAVGVEQPFGLEPFDGLAKGEFERAEPFRFNAADGHLIIAAWRINS